MDADGRLGTPADIGKVVALLCSDDAGWITGQMIYADGGASLMMAGLPTALQGFDAIPRDDQEVPEASATDAPVGV